MGTRGIPACYSGFETFYENVATRLAARGYDITVYNRSNYISYKEPYYKRVRLVRLPTIRNKHLDTIFHTFLSIIHAIFKKYDVVYLCIVGNSPLCFIPRLFGSKVILNVDGADWQREKWSLPAKIYLRACEYFATIFPNIIIADSKVIQRRYLQEHNANTIFIPYGANIEQLSKPEFLRRFNLEKDKYILFVGRLVPENCAHLLIEAFNQIETELKLVIIGDAPYSESYKKRLKEMADERTIFTGYLFGDGYKTLSCNAYFFVLPSGIQGTRPALLDQLGFGNCVLVRDSFANIEVIKDAGISFKGEKGIWDLKDKMELLIKNPQIVYRYSKKAVKRIKEQYLWDNIVDQYEELFGRIKGFKKS